MLGYDNFARLGAENGNRYDHVSTGIDIQRMVKKYNFLKLKST